MVTVWTLRITATVVHGLAQIFTFFRLAHRSRKGRLWLDDACASIAMVCSLVWLVCYWIYTDVPGVGPFGQSELFRIRSYWVDSTMFLVVVWLSRMSLMFSFIRSSPPGILSRKLPFFGSVLFLLMWASLLAQRIYLCHRDETWQDQSQPKCDNQTIKITVLAFELFSNLIILATPAVTLIAGTVYHAQHRVLLILLFCAVIITAASVVHAVYWIHEYGVLLEDLSAIIESGASLMFINLAVGIMFFHQRMDRNVEYPDDLEYPDGSSTFRKKRGSISLKQRIGSPHRLNAIRLSLQASGHESFATSIPHIYLDDNTTLAGSTTDVSKIHGAEKTIDSGVELEPYTPTIYAEETSKLFRHKSYQSSLSRYSDDSPTTANFRHSADSRMSTCPMLSSPAKSDHQLSPPPTAAPPNKSVRFLTPMPPRSPAPSVYSSIYNRSLIDEDPFHRREPAPPLPRMESNVTVLPPGRRKPLTEAEKPIPF
ncbi:hypothetical protein EDD85DRAFT_179794 [Armillaria nabsnona]|nr:hypothetical protein EDD85DRAFT_179794 [Armillaria nabsnona]